MVGWVGGSAAVCCYRNANAEYPSYRRTLVSRGFSINGYCDNAPGWRRPDNPRCGLAAADQSASSDRETQALKAQNVDEKQRPVKYLIYYL